MRIAFNRRWRLLACWLCLWLPLGAWAANTLDWNKGKDRLSADVRQMPLPAMLEQLASQTSWQVFLEPGTAHDASVKFKDLPSGEGLRMLLGDLNFALIPQTNSPSRLYVFRTGMGKATKRIGPAETKKRGNSHRIPNELLVQLKPGVDAEALARQLGAKIIGRIPELNIYQLQFADAAAADAAKDLLSANDDVMAVDYNYSVDRPPNAEMAVGASATTPELKLNPPTEGGCQPIVGVVDTGVQSFGNNLDQFVTKRLAVSGAATAASDTPTHGTTMVYDILSTLSVVGKGSASVQIVAVDVFGPNGQTTTFNVAAGIVLAVNNGATIINLSLGSPGDSSVLQNVVKQVADRGIGMVAAAGNEPTGQPIYPAGYAGVMPVTAVQNGQLAPYANSWSGVQVGTSGNSLMNYNGNTWYSQGTSVSAAYVTGVAAGLSQTGCPGWPQVQSAISSKLAVPAGK